MSRNEQLTRIKWRCSRRGMLELDTLLTRYYDKHAQQLNEKQLNQLEQLLEYPDPVLLDWVLGRSDPEDQEMMQIIATIRDLR